MEDENEKEYSQSQMLEGYGCTCGYKNENKKEFNTHLMLGGKKDGKGVHKSIGRINMQTGEVVVPPYNERTPEERAQTTFKVNSPRRDNSINQTVRTTDDWQVASEVRVVPRIFQMDFTPTMRMAKVASIREWNWSDMGWADFFDTCLYILFKEHGITLAGYIVENPQEEEEVKIGSTRC